jgi:mono/diheme cytochrome c family protein
MTYTLLIVVFLSAIAAMPSRESGGGFVGNVSAGSATELYARHCASCHGRDGRATTRKSRLKYHARDLTEPDWQENVSDERIFNSIINGKGKMPGYSKRLSEPEIDSLVSHVRALR